MPATPSLKDLLDDLKLDRTAFAEVYDRLRPDGAPDFKTIALLRDGAEPAEARTRLDMLEALETAEREGWLEAFNAAGVPSLFRSAKGFIALQAIINPAIDLKHIGAVSDGHLWAMQRCCRIVVGPGLPPVTGSGFLIGPQLVLTNWHVIKGLIDPDPAVQRANHVHLKIEFDLFQLRDGTTAKATDVFAAEDWLAASSAAHSRDVSPAKVNVVRVLPAKLDDLARHMDYAVLELASPVGYERGWYDLGKVKEPVVGGAGVLVQFPGPYAMRVTPGNYVTQSPPGDLPGRVLHGMNCIAGSSGGLCADPGVEPLALHQGAWVLQDDAQNPGQTHSVCNVAIPLKLIAAEAGPTVGLRAAAAQQLLHSTRTDGRPILGRAGLQRAIHEAMTGPVRILLVKNSYDPQTGQLKRGVGKSFSQAILETMAPPDANLIRAISAADLPSEPYPAAKALAAPFRDASPAATLAIDALPDKPAGDTAQDADLRLLVEPLVEVLKKAAGNRTLWLIIDDLDRHPVQPTSGTSSLLNLLYQRIDKDPQLRVMLIGPTADLPALTGLSMRSEGPLGDLTEPEVESWIRLRRGLDQPIPPDMVALVRSVVGSLVQERIAQGGASQPAVLGEILGNHVARQLK